MVKAAWGKKHTCPKCGTRFYDLGKKGPAVCIECEHKWVPEQILKTKQGHVAPPKPANDAADQPADSAAAPDSPAKGKTADLDKGGAEGVPGTAEAGDDEDGGKNAGVLGDVSLDDDKEDMAGIVDAKLEQGGSE